MLWLGLSGCLYMRYRRPSSIHLSDYFLGHMDQKMPSQNDWCGENGWSTRPEDVFLIFRLEISCGS